MAQVIRFFPRQALAGGAVAAGLNSDVFEVPEAAQVLAEFRCYAMAGQTASIGVSGVIQACMNSQLDSWTNIASAMVTGVTGIMMSANPLCRFIRGVLIPGNLSGAIVSFEGLAKNST